MAILLRWLRSPTRTSPGSRGPQRSRWRRRNGRRRARGAALRRAVRPRRDRGHRPVRRVAAAAGERGLLGRHARPFPRPGVRRGDPLAGHARDRLSGAHARRPRRLPRGAHDRREARARRLQRGHDDVPAHRVRARDRPPEPVDVRLPASVRHRARRRVGALLDARERGRRDPVGAVPGVAARARRVRDRPVPRRRRHAAGRHRDAPAAGRRRTVCPASRTPSSGATGAAPRASCGPRRPPLAPGRRHAVPVRRPGRLRGDRHRPARDDRDRPHPPRARGADHADVGLVERRDRLAAVDLAAHRRHLRREPSSRS